MSFKTYLFEYRHDGAVWGFSVHATSRADALERVKKMGWARLQGERIAVIPVPAVGLVHRVLRWLGRAE